MKGVADSCLRFSHQAMGTLFEIFIAGQPPEYSRQAAVAAFSEISRVESILSRHDPGSDVGQLRRLRPGRTLRVGIELVECLEHARKAYVLTAGAFDVTIGCLRRDSRPKSAPMGPAMAAGIGFWRFRFDPSGHIFFHVGPTPQLDFENPSSYEASAAGYPAVTLTGNSDLPADNCLDLDFGGIGKGYALEKAVDILRVWEIDRALIHGGTSTAVAIGDAPENAPGKSGWPVGVGGGCRPFYLEHMALSGSGKEVKGEHVFDPRSGHPATGHRSAWAAHPSPALADALSTAFLVMTPAELEVFCRSHPQVRAVALDYSDATREYNRGALQ